MQGFGTDVNRIRAEPCATCSICGSSGTLIYSEQRDRIFEAPGRWSMMRCDCAPCGTIWLNPMPIPDDIGKAYANYYTHSSRANLHAPSALERLYRQLRSDYLAARFGYSRSARRHPLPLRLTRWIIPLFPLKQAEADAAVRYLPAEAGGRLLDVGCGSGDWLESMSALGWEVSGVDFDAGAVAVGRKRGLSIHRGSVEDQHFPENTFDAVTLHHVIEHVSEPVETLRECARILRHGGKLIVATPNADSLSHRVYKQNWRGLEPPRHLHIFSFASLREALARAGLHDVQIVPQPSTSILYESHLLRRDRKGPLVGVRSSPLYMWAAKSLATAELFLVKWRPSLADAMTAVATKS